MDKDLKWLAENLEEWGNDRYDLVRRAQGVYDVVFSESVNTAPFAREQYYTKNQWKNARIELGLDTGWNGAEDGLPPVGTKCEALEPLQRNWLAVEIVYHHPSPASAPAAACIDDNYGLFWAYEFRPVRSEEDKAIEDMKRSIAKHPDAPTYYHALYRDGWRKTEEAG